MVGLGVYFKEDTVNKTCWEAMEYEARERGRVEKKSEYTPIVCLSTWVDE